LLCSGRPQGIAAAGYSAVKVSRVAFNDHMTSLSIFFCQGVLTNRIVL
jgi:hypothetical protein